MTNDVNAPGVQAEGTALPPPRAFGESNTLTLPRLRRNKAAQQMAVRLLEAAVGKAAGHTSVAVVPADATPLTITF